MGRPPRRAVAGRRGHGIAGVCGLGASRPEPPVPPQLLRVRNFAGANLTTPCVYGALTMSPLAISLYTQQVVGYCATVAGLVTLPSPVISFLFAKRVGRLAARIGPRNFLMAGQLTQC